MVAYSNNPKLKTIMDLIPKEEGTYKFIYKNSPHSKEQPYGWLWVDSEKDNGETSIWIASDSTVHKPRGNPLANSLRIKVINDSKFEAYAFEQAISMWYVHSTKELEVIVDKYYNSLTQYDLIKDYMYITPVTPIISRHPLIKFFARYVKWM